MTRDEILAKLAKGEISAAEASRLLDVADEASVYHLNDDDYCDLDEKEHWDNDDEDDCDNDWDDEDDDDEYDDDDDDDWEWGGPYGIASATTGRETNNGCAGIMWLMAFLFLLALLSAVWS